MEHKSDGVRVSGSSLVVHFTGTVGATIRHSTVTVPLKDLVLSASVTQALDREARRILVEHWSGMEIPMDPLF